MPNSLAVPSSAATMHSAASSASNPIPELLQRASGGEQQAVLQLLRHLGLDANGQLRQLEQAGPGKKKAARRQQTQALELQLQAAKALLWLLQQRPHRDEIRNSLMGAAGAARALASLMLLEGPGREELSEICCTVLWQLCLSTSGSSTALRSQSGPASEHAASLIQQGALEAAVKLLLRPTALPVNVLVGAAGIVEALGCDQAGGSTPELQATASCSASGAVRPTAAAPALGLLGQHVQRLHQLHPPPSTPTTHAKGVAGLLVELLRPSRPAHVWLDALRSLRTILDQDCRCYGPCVIAAGACPTLLELLQPSTARSAALQSAAAAVLCALAAEVDHHAALLAAGAVSIVLRLISDGSEDKGQCVAILSNLCSPATRGAMLAAGAVPALVRLLLRGDSCVKFSASTALSNMMDEDTDDLEVAFAAAEGSTAALAAAVSGLLGVRRKDEEPTLALIPVLRLVRHRFTCRGDDEGQQAAGEQQEDSPNRPPSAVFAAAGENAAAAAARQKAAEALVSAGAIPTLLSCIGSAAMHASFDSRRGGSSASVLMVLEHALWALSNLLAQGGAACTPAARAEVIAALMQLLQQPSFPACVHEPAAAALFHLMLYSGADAKVVLQQAVAAGAVPALVALLGHSSPGVQLAAVRAVRCLTEVLRNQPSKAKGPKQSGATLGILSAGTAAGLVALLQHQNAEVRSTALKSIANLALHTHRAGDVFKAAGALPALHALQRLDGRREVTDVARAAELDIECGCRHATQPSSSGTAACALGSVSVRQECEGCGVGPGGDGEEGSGDGGKRQLSLCGGCSAVRYCSRQCQVAHWREHKARCKQLAEVKQAIPVGGGSVAVAVVVSKSSEQRLGEVVVFAKDGSPTAKMFVPDAGVQEPEDVAKVEKAAQILTALQLH